MNIPLTTPSAFQPGNILCSSTPIKPKASRHTVARATMQDIHLDPNETPIKGHGVKRKTKPASASSSGSSITKPQIRKPTATVASRLSVVRHIPPRPTPDPVRSSPQQQQRHLEDSESDHTDSDSCNVSEKRNVKTIPDVPVIKSTDTDNDFPTTDFNNEIELNDLNRTGGKNAPPSGNISNPQSEAVERNPGVHLSSSGHPLPVIENQGYRSSGPSQPPHERGASPYRGNSPQGSSHRSPPVLRKKIYTEPSGQTTSTATDSVLRRFDSQVRNLPLNNNFMTNPNNNVPRVSEMSQNASGKALTSAKPVLRHSPVSLDSVADDLLFDGPNPSSPSQKTPRTPGTGEMNSLILGLSRGNNVQLKTPQDPSVDPVLPAVMTAKSSDLTTFSQRSPGRFGRYNPEPPPPPFSLALVNPTESRPRILRTPPPSQPVEKNRVSHYTPPRQQHDRDSSDGDNRTSPYQKYDDREIPPRKDFRLEDTPQGDDRFTPDSYDGAKLLGNMNNCSVDSVQNGQYSRSRNEHDIDERQSTRQNNLGGLSYESIDNDSIDRQFPESCDPVSLVEIDPLSTNDWYTTPAKHAVHIISSVQKSTSSLDYHLHPASEYNRADHEMPEKPLEADKDTQGKFDADLPEFLPIQKRPSRYEDRSVISRKDVASRLRSVFFKDSTETAQKDNTSDYSPVDKSGILSSDHKGHTTTQSKFRPANTQEKERVTESRNDRDTSGNSHSSVSKFNSSAIKTEKLKGETRSGSAFIPIHPQPTTTTPITKQRVETENQDIAHPVPRESEDVDRQTEIETLQADRR